MLRFFSFAMLTALLFTGCALRTTPLPEPESEGAKAYKEVCGTCHALAHPRRNTYAQWEHLVGVMEVRMAERQRPPMTTEEKAQILLYLKKNSR
ncbi:MAG: hypothetical protein ACE5DW_02660 [Thermodesulfobacteriota bacterium]